MNIKRTTTWLTVLLVLGLASQALAATLTQWKMPKDEHLFTVAPLGRSVFMYSHFVTKTSIDGEVTAHDPTISRFDPRSGQLLQWPVPDIDLSILFSGPYGLVPYVDTEGNLLVYYGPYGPSGFLKIIRLSPEANTYEVWEDLPRSDFLTLLDSDGTLAFSMAHKIGVLDPSTNELVTLTPDDALTGGSGSDTIRGLGVTNSGAIFFNIQGFPVTSIESINLYDPSKWGSDVLISWELPPNAVGFNPLYVSPESGHVFFIGNNHTDYTRSAYRFDSSSNILTEWKSSSTMLLSLTLDTVGMPIIVGCSISAADPTKCVDGATLLLDITEQGIDTVLTPVRYKVSVSTKILDHKVVNSMPTKTILRPASSTMTSTPDGAYSVWKSAVHPLTPVAGGIRAGTPKSGIAFFPDKGRKLIRVKW